MYCALWSIPKLPIAALSPSLALPQATRSTVAFGATAPAHCRSMSASDSSPLLFPRACEAGAEHDA